MGSHVLSCCKMVCVITTQVKTTIVPYVQALMDGMPPKCKLPRYEYGTKGMSVCMCVCLSIYCLSVCMFVSMSDDY